MWSLGIVLSVFLRSRIEMPARACKSLTFTLAHRMNVNTMRAGRQLRDLYVDANTATRRLDRCSTDLLSLRVDYVRLGGGCCLLCDCRRAVHHHCRRQAECRGRDEKSTHWNEPPSKFSDSVQIEIRTLVRFRGFCSRALTKSSTKMR